MKFFDKPLFCLMLLLASFTLFGQGDPEPIVPDTQWLATSRFVNGNPLAGGTSGQFNAFLIFKSVYLGETTLPDFNIPHSQIGALWGVESNPVNKHIYSSAILKRHVGFGPGGIGAIYDIDPTAAVPAAALLADLVSLGADLGTDPRTATSGEVDDANELPADADKPSWDNLAFDLVGKAGIGGIDLSEDVSKMAVINLKMRELVILNLLGAPSILSTHAIPNPGCSNGEFRPWAVKYYNGKIYVGVVCSAETSQLMGDLTATIYEFEDGNFTSIFSFPLDYPRGVAGGGAGMLTDPAEWLPWTNTLQSVSASFGGGIVIYPQPILSDIEIDTNGAIIVALMDRNGHQTGNSNYGPDVTSATLYNGQGAGDLLRIGKVNGIYQLESNGQIDGVQAETPGCFGGASISGANNGQGPGGGEFYWSDHYAYNPCNTDPASGAAGIHQEICFGGIALIPSLNAVVMTCMDPTSTANSGGISFHNNTTGRRLVDESAPFNQVLHGFRLYNASSPGNFSKASGLGDIDAYSLIPVLPPNCALLPTATKTDIICSGSNTGAIDVSVAGATAPLSYVWSTGATTEDLSTLTAGDYTVTVTESPTCSITLFTTLLEPATGLNVVCSAIPVSGAGFTNGTVSVTASNGDTPYSYLWSTGATDNTIFGIGAGFYTVTVTDNNGCTATCISEVTSPVCTIAATTTQINESCPNSDNGSIDLTVTGNNGGFNTFWSNGTFNEDVSSLPAGIYTVTITDIASCSTIATVTITEPSVLTLTCSATAATTVNGVDGSANVMVTGGTFPYTYLWSNAVLNANNIGLSAGSYTVIVTDANGCSNQCVTIVGEPTCSFEITGTAPALLCENETANIDITPLNATGLVTYAWSFGATTEDVDGLFPDTYTVIATDASGCDDELSFVILGSAPYTLTCTSQPITGPGFTNGVVGVDVVGATFPFSYLWSTGYTGSYIFGVGPGSYEVTVTDGNNCTASCSSVIEDIACSLSIESTTVTPVSCNGLSDGAIDITISGATISAIANWSNMQQQEDLSNLSAGTYTVTVNDVANCTQSLSITITQPSSLILTCSATDATTAGGNQGTASVTALGGTTPYTYAWSNGATDAAISTLVAGTYTVTVTDANDCLTICESVVNQPSCGLSLIGTSSPTLCAGELGNIDITTTNATNTTTTYLWSNGSTTEDINALTAGTYTVTATDNLGCTAALSKTIIISSAIIPSCVVTQGISGPNFSDAIIGVTANGGTPTYTYLWSNGATTAAVYSVGASNYTATVTDANNCEATCELTVIDVPCTLAASYTQTDVSCNGASDGAINLTVTGATLNFAANWSNGASTEDLSNLSAGTYTVTVNDVANCTQSLSITITQPGSLTLTCSATDATSAGGNQGTASVTALGGTTPYTYAWSNGATDAAISTLVAGTYTVTVTDANDCFAICESVVNQPNCNLVLVENVTPISCFGETGSIELLVSGGNGNISYNWSNGSDQADQADLSAGSYTVTVTDATQCQTILSVTLTAPSALVLDCNATELSGPSFTDATLTVAANGGTPTYTYLWSNGATTANVFSVGAGSYTATVTDANNCEATCELSVTDVPCTLAVTYTQSDASCNGASNGAINLTVTGATLNFAANWSNGASTEDLSNLSAGTYTVTVNDVANCTQSLSITINQPGSLTLTCSAADAITAGGNQGSASVTALGGTTPYTYAWSNGATDAAISTLVAGTYTVTVTDANDCFTICESVINQPNCNLVLVENVTPISCFGETGSIELLVSGGNGNITYSWSNGSDQADQAGLSAGSYTVTVTDATQCQTNLSVTLTAPSALILDCNATELSGPSFTDATLTVTANGGTPTYTYLWSNDATTANVFSVGAGNYTATVTDANNCEATCETVVEEVLCSIALSIYTSEETCSTPNNGTAIATATGAFNGIGYVWSNGETMAAIQNLGAGTYTVTATDGANCSTIATATINPPQTIEVSCTAANTTSPNGTNGLIVLQVFGGSGDFQYLWTNGEISAAINNLSAGVYTVTVSDPISGCSDVCTATVTDPSCQLALQGQIQDVQCYDTPTGGVSLFTNGAFGTVVYNWSNGATSTNLQNVKANSYTVTATDEAGCTVVSTFMVNQPENLSLVCSKTDQTDVGINNGAAFVLASGGTINYFYAWSNGSLDAEINNLAPGIYTVTVTDNNGCTESCSSEVLAKPTEDCQVLQTDNITLALFDIAGQSGLYYKPTGAGLALSALDQNTASLSGTIVNKNNPDQAWNVNFVLKNKQTATEWMNAGNMLISDAVNGCTTYNSDNWKIWELEAATSTFSGLGAFAGQSLQLYDLTFPNGNVKKSFIQIGEGAPVISCENGFAAWFAFQGDQNGQGDFYALLDCEADPEEEEEQDPTACEVLNTDNITLALFDIPGQSSQYYKPTANGLFLEVLGDGTAKLHGSIVNKENSNQRWEVNYTLTNQQTSASWLDQGNMLQIDQNSGCSNFDVSDWDIWLIQSQISTLIGQGEFAGQTLNINNVEYPNGNVKKSFLQIGDDAAVISCEYGMAAWFAFSGSQTGTGDFYAALECDFGNSGPKVKACKLDKGIDYNHVFIMNGNRYVPAATGISFVRAEDGTGIITGTLQNRLNADDKYVLTIHLSNEQTQTQWLAAGNILNLTNCSSATPADWDFWIVNGTTSTLTGLGNNFGINAKIRAMKKTGVALGEGATGKCGYGLGARLRVYGDINANALLRASVKECQDLNCGNNNPFNCTYAQALVQQAETEITDQQELLLFPNPAAKELHIDAIGLEEQVIEISIYDMSGRLYLQDSTRYENTINLDVSAMPIGIYMVRVKGEATAPITQLLSISR